MPRPPGSLLRSGWRQLSGPGLRPAPISCPGGL